MREYTEQDCINSIRKLAQEIEHSPSKRDYMQSDKKPSLTVIYDRFGSWNTAKEAADLDTFWTVAGSRYTNGRKFVPSIVTTDQGYEMAQSKNDQVYIHRLLAIAEHGFDAVKDMDVHHINDIPWDNRPCNVQPLSHAEHSRLHAVARWGDDDE